MIGDISLVVSGQTTEGIIGDDGLESKSVVEFED